MEACYKLVNNLDLSNYPNWNPIGINNENVTPFRGNLNGNVYSKFGLNRNSRNSILPFDTDTNAYMGLFGRIENALIINLKLMDINYTFDCSQLNIKNSHCLVGGLAGSSINSEIRNIKVTGTMNIRSRAARFDNTQFQFCGGIIGEATSTNILYCGSAVDIHATYRYQSIGGIIGEVYEIMAQQTL